MKKTIFSLSMLALLFGSEVFAVTVVDKVSIGDGGSLPNTQNLINSDSNKDQATGDSASNQSNTTFRSKVETEHKNPKDYPKKAH